MDTTSEDMMRQASNVWKLLDDMAENHPHEYKKFIDSQMKQFRDTVEEKQQQASFVPEPGFVVQTFLEEVTVMVSEDSLNKEIGEYYVNVCYSDKIRSPILNDGKMARTEKDLDQCSLPISIGSRRELPLKTSKIFIVDVVTHTLVFKRCCKDFGYKNYVATKIFSQLQALETEHYRASKNKPSTNSLLRVRFRTNSITFLNIRYKGGKTPLKHTPLLSVVDPRESDVSNEDVASPKQSSEYPSTLLSRSPTRHNAKESSTRVDSVTLSNNNVSSRLLSNNLNSKYPIPHKTQPLITVIDSKPACTEEKDKTRTPSVPLSSSKLLSKRSPLNDKGEHIVSTLANTVSAGNQSESVEGDLIGLEDMVNMDSSNCKVSQNRSKAGGSCTSFLTERLTNYFSKGNNQRNSQILHTAKVSESSENPDQIKSSVSNPFIEGNMKAAPAESTNREVLTILENAIAVEHCEISRGTSNTLNLIVQLRRDISWKDCSFDILGDGYSVLICIFHPMLSECSTTRITIPFFFDSRKVLGSWDKRLSQLRVALFQ